ncbi:MAG: hypothetical protein EHM72_00290 [Calditrichaeota bacterium]|nr:MAG: hypothetical protein EHM72_00290 [Calditrichota bacterium]
MENIRLYEKDFVILGEDRRGPYLLPDSLIIEHSETVYLNDSKLQSSAYSLDYIRGELRFEESVAKEVEIRINYKVFPFPLKKSVFHRQILHRVFGAPALMQDVNAPADQAGEEDYASKLSKSGSITRGVTVGSNRGLKVNSALNINVAGKVGEQVEVIAALTDQTTPIQPDGTTQNLQEIDKVFIQIKSPSFSTTLGDFQIEYSETELSRYNRKLQGVLGETAYKNISAKASAAVSRGKYYSMAFTGQEGNQGPYQLKGDRGQIDIIVLAGTERVFIDGEAMIRGETNDYTIDYSSAQITFTRKRLITSDSRITIDFQYSDEQYRRNLYSASVAADLWKSKVKLRSLFLHEADDKNNPLDFTLTDDYQTILSAAGDDLTKAVINGANYVGPQNGRYTKENDHYKYAGENQGEYLITFSDVGSMNGDYEYKGNAIFEFVGIRKGRYAPVILLPLPKSHNMINFFADASPLSFINLKGETAFSFFDVNSFSNVDDQDNQGLAQNYELSFKPPHLRIGRFNLGKIGLVGRYKTIDDQFTDIDRTTEVEYNRRWDISAAASRQELVKEFRTSYEPFTGFHLATEWGSIKKGDSFYSSRKQFEQSLNWGKLPKTSYRLEKIERESPAVKQSADWLRQMGDVQWTFWRLSPMIRYEGEIKKENWSDSLFTGFKFDDLKTGLSFEPFSKVKISGEYSQRKDKEYTAFEQFTEKSLAKTQNMQILLERFKIWTTSIDLTHRVKTFASPNMENSRTDLAELRTQLIPFNRAINANMNYQIANTATALKEKVYISVPEGEGNYRYDEELKEYVYDPLGDHILRILTTDQFIPTVELKTSGRLRLEPTNFFKNSSSEKGPLWNSVVKALSTESFVTIEERTQRKSVNDIYLLKLSKFRSPGETIFGTLQFRQDLYLFERSRDFSLRLRYASRDELNNQFLEGGEKREEEEYSARVTTRFSEKVNSQSEVTNSRTARFFNYQGKQNRDIHSLKINSDISITPVSIIKLSLEGRFSLEKDLYYLLPTKVQSFAVIPQMTYSIKNKGRVRGEFEWSFVKVNPSDRILPYEMANGRSAGKSFRVDIRFDYRISEVMQATLSYNGRNEPERHGVIHTGRAQITAAFR